MKRCAMSKSPYNFWSHPTRITASYHRTACRIMSKSYLDGIRGAIANWRPSLGSSNGTMNSGNRRTSVCRFAGIGSGIGMIMTKSGLLKSEKDHEEIVSQRATIVALSGERVRQDMSTRYVGNCYSVSMDFISRILMEVGYTGTCKHSIFLLWACTFTSDYRYPGKKFILKLNATFPRPSISWINEMATSALFMVREAEKAHYKPETLDMDLDTDAVDCAILEQFSMTKESCTAGSPSLNKLDKHCLSSGDSKLTDSNADYEKLLFTTHGCSIYHHERILLNNQIDI